MRNNLHMNLIESVYASNVIACSTSSQTRISEMMKLNKSVIIDILHLYTMRNLSLNETVQTVKPFEPFMLDFVGHLAIPGQF